MERTITLKAIPNPQPTTNGTPYPCPICSYLSGHAYGCEEGKAS